MYENQAGPLSKHKGFLDYYQAIMKKKTRYKNKKIEYKT